LAEGWRIIILGAVFILTSIFMTGVGRKAMPPHRASEMQPVPKRLRYVLFAIGKFAILLGMFRLRGIA
jgi:hypothetical protein